MGFPFSTSSPVFTYDILSAGGDRSTVPIAKLSLKALRKAASAQFEHAVLPEALDQAKPYQWAWAWLDGQNPVSAGPFLVFGIRGWEKKVPPSLLKARLNQAIAKWSTGNPDMKVSKLVISQVREDVEAELIRKAQFSIRFDTVAIDVTRWRLFLFAGADKHRETLLNRVLSMLSTIKGLEDVKAAPWTLTDYLNASRPGANMLPEYGTQFLWWLAHNALDARTAEFTIQGQEEPVYISLELDKSMTVKEGDGAHRVTGANVTERYAESIAGNDGDNRVVRISLGLLVRWDADTRERFTLTIDEEGRIRKCVCLSARRIKPKNDNLEDAVSARGDDFSIAAHAMRLLFQGFDFEVIEDFTETARQVPMFPGAAQGPIVWHSDRPYQDAESEDNGQLSIGDAAGLSTGEDPAVA